MTAQRWWVKMAARWLARVDGVSGQLRLAMLGMTALSTGVVALRSYGHGEYAWPLIAGTGLLTILYTYLYTEGGVWNQQRRDKADMATNWAGPPSRFNTEIQARALYAALEGRELTEEEREAVSREAEHAWKEWRDGIDKQTLEEES